MRLHYKTGQKFHFAVVFTIVSTSFFLYAYSTGITGVTLKNGDGCTCHNPTPSANVSVMISGPTQLLPNQTAEYTVTISGGALTAAGTNIAASEGVLNIGTGLQKIGDELTHTSPKTPVSGNVAFTFNYTAPATPQSVTLYANGNSVNLNGGNDGDQWNFAQNFSLEITNDVPVELTSFAAQVTDNNVILNWSTASEENNSSFQIERKQSNEDWNYIGFVTGKGTTTETSKYFFTDKNLSNGIYNYRLKQIDFDGSFKYYDLNSEVDINLVNTFELSQNFPNPFNPSTVINWQIANDGFVTLRVYDITGKEVALLVNNVMKAGKHSVNFDAANLSSGTYFYELRSGDFNVIKKLLLMK
jgi:hypothetical protein